MAKEISQGKRKVIFLMCQNVSRDKVMRRPGTKSMGKFLWGTGKRAFFFGAVFVLILLYALCVNMEGYAVSHTSKITVLSCDDEPLSEPLELSVLPPDGSFEPDEDSRLFPSVIHVKSLSPLPSFYPERNTCFDAVASRTPGRVRISTYYVFLNRSYRHLHYEIDDPALWNIVIRSAKERAADGEAQWK